MHEGKKSNTDITLVPNGAPGCWMRSRPPVWHDLYPVADAVRAIFLADAVRAYIFLTPEKKTAGATEHMAPADPLRECAELNVT